MDIKPIISGSSGNAYLVSDGETRILIECGVSYKKIQQGLDWKLNEVSAVLISHQHQDHCHSVKDCVKSGVDCYAPAEVFTRKNISGHCCHALQPLKSFTVGTFLIVPFDLDHDVVNYGYLLSSRVTKERLIYFTDTFQVKYKFDGITHIMAECNFGEEEIDASVSSGRTPVALRNRIAATHMSRERLAAYFMSNDLSNVKQIYLIHTSKNHLHRERSKGIMEGVTGKEVVVC